MDHRIYLVPSEKDLIENETEYKLSSPVIGNIYQCEVTLEDVTVITSDAFEYKYEISHHPTAAEPYVETNYDEGAAYQWFKENNNDVEITDENAFPRDNNDGGEFATYDEETGWTGIPVYEGGEGGSESMPSGDCTCICHHNNPISRFIYKLIQMIRSIFGIYSECRCGIVHV